MFRLALIGFGNVGSGLARLLRQSVSSEMQRLSEVTKIVAVSDLRYGTVLDPEGISSESLSAAVEKDQSFAGLPGYAPDWSVEKIIKESNANVIVELTPTDLKTGGTALDHVRWALDAGKHVVTTNKGPVAVAYKELSQLAEKKGLHFAVEGTVMSGTPVIQLGLENIRLAGILAIRGVLNGTCNYMLGQMEQGVSYEDALADAQAQGFAEADPAGDVEGWDPAGKLVILSNLFAGIPLTLNDVDTTGITGLTAESFAEAKKKNCRWKLLAELAINKGSVDAKVSPVMVESTDPLAHVQGATNAMTFKTEVLGEVTMVGPGAGREETAFAILSDLWALQRKQEIQQNS